jgi:hypothetical protein
VRGEERGIGLGVSHLPRRVLDAVLADVQAQAGRVVGPGAAGAVEPAVLVVHHHQSPYALQGFRCVFQDRADAAGRAPARGRMVLLVPGEVAVLSRTTAQRRARDGAEHALLGVAGGFDVPFCTPFAALSSPGR